MIEPPVEIEAPDIGAHRRGNTGIPYVTSFASGRAGPHAVITALVHGNELCGVHALLALLEREVRPAHGRLSLAFVNTLAYERFDPDNPKLTRYVDEDLNRVWDSGDPRGRTSFGRARAGARDPAADRGRRCAARPALDAAAGAAAAALRHPRQRPPARRRDRLSGARGGRCRPSAPAPGCATSAAFADPASPAAAMLVECGQHWARSSVDGGDRDLPAVPGGARPGRRRRRSRASAPAPAAEPQRVIEVTHAITVERRTVPLHRRFPGPRGDRRGRHADRSRRRPAAAHALRRLRADHAVAPPRPGADGGAPRPLRRVRPCRRIGAREEPVATLSLQPHALQRLADEA